MNKNHTIAILILIILVGVSLRFYNIGKESFWLDEGATGLAMKKYSTGQIFLNILRDGQLLPGYYPYNTDLPVYYISLSIWTNLFNVSDTSLRAFSALFGSLSIMIIFYLGRLLFDDKTAILATFFSSINLTLIDYSQEARQYSFLLFLSLVSVVIFLKYLKSKKWTYLVMLLLCNALIIYSHYPWFLFIAAEGVYATCLVCNQYIKHKKLDKRLIAVFLVLGLMYLPLISRVLSTNTDTVKFFGRPNAINTAEFGVQLSTWLYPADPMRQKLHNTPLNLSLYEWLLLSSVVLITIIFAFVFVIGVIKMLHKRQYNVLVFFFFPLFLALLFSFIHPIISIFKLKYLIYLLPLYVLVAAFGLMKTKYSKHIIILIVLLSVLPLQAYYTNINKQQFREAAEFLKTNEPIFININTAQVAFKYYYGEKSNVIEFTNVDELKSSITPNSSFWILLTFTRYSDPDGEIKKFLNNNYNLVEQKEFFDISLLHYTKK